MAKCRWWTAAFTAAAGMAFTKAHRQECLCYEKRSGAAREGARLCYNFQLVSQGQQSRRYLVTGAVQGVGFRYFTQHAAAKLRLSGYVRNLRDGRVEVFASGTPEQLAHLRAQLERGPRFSSVQQVHEEEAAGDERYAKDFVIAHDD